MNINILTKLKDYDCLLKLFSPQNFISLNEISEPKMTCGNSHKINSTQYSAVSRHCYLIHLINKNGNKRPYCSDNCDYHKKKLVQFSQEASKECEKYLLYLQDNEKAILGSRKMYTEEIVLIGGRRALNDRMKNLNFICKTSQTSDKYLY